MEGFCAHASQVRGFPQAWGPWCQNAATQQRHRLIMLLILCRKVVPEEWVLLQMGCFLIGVLKVSIYPGMSAKDNVTCIAHVHQTSDRASSIKFDDSVHPPSKNGKYNL